ncbi:MAG: AMP-binding protein, partial [Desulfotomaculaceae bacterium]|nr:AMP-binding protein [Desulfotomaculaceae bacterium]
MLVHELIFQGPDDKIALYEKGVKTSYAGLKTKVAQYRSCLHARGVRAKENVAIFAKNSANFISSYLAIASLGCVVVPLNTMLTPREISFVIKDAKTKYIVT